MRRSVATDVLGIGRDELSPEALESITTAHPRPHFEQHILRAFADGMRHRPDTTFATVNADVSARFDDSFVRFDFVDLILGSDRSEWPRYPLGHSSIPTHMFARIAPTAVFIR
ncbi:hypothetical protein [Nocardia paucivorans]|uniref:hypothetical protein n=1 Tax=Nocardia paucivorans TaxID=114259 RepID=UPI00030C2FF1